MGLRTGIKILKGLTMKAKDLIIGAFVLAAAAPVSAARDSAIRQRRAGLAAGFAYWAIAGWNAGFWKPVFRRPEAPAPAPKVS